MITNNNDKKRLFIFVAVAFGLSYFIGLLMWYGSRIGANLMIPVTSQMLYPASGVILGFMLTNREKRNLPNAFFVTFLIVNLIYLVFSLISVSMPAASPVMQTITPLTNYVLSAGSILGILLVIAAGKEKRKESGLDLPNIKTGIWLCLLFIAIFIVRVIVSALSMGFLDGVGTQYFTEWASRIMNPALWIEMLALPINFVLLILLYFGEEYGWRYYLQPILQKKFGLRFGVILLGLIWGIWHLPIDMLYYTQTSGMQMLILQFITCTFLAIFFGYAYMKTHNIWVLVMLHFLNNNLIPYIQNTFSTGVQQNQTVSLSDIPVAFILNGLCFGFFLLSDVFRKKGERIGEESEDVQPV